MTTYPRGHSACKDFRNPVQVTIQFTTEGGTDCGNLKEVNQFYIQNGKTIEHPMYTVNGNPHNTITGATRASPVS